MNTPVCDAVNRSDALSHAMFEWADADCVAFAVMSKTGRETSDLPLVSDARPARVPRGDTSTA